MNDYTRSGFFTKKEASLNPQRKKILVGFDGFIDTIVHLVDQRKGPDEWTRIEKIADFASRIALSSGKSSNIECIETTAILGGNAPLLAQTLASVGNDYIDVDLLGALSQSPEEDQPAAPFLPLLRRPNVTAISIGASGKTQAFEFNDGKILFGSMRDVSHLSLNSIFNIASSSYLTEYISTLDALATVNWTMAPLVHEFWDWMANATFFFEHRGPILFVDFADPKKREICDLIASLDLLKKIRSKGFRVAIGMNRSEALQIMNALSLFPDEEDSLSSLTAALAKHSRCADIFVGHSHTEACVSYYTSGSGASSEYSHFKIRVPYLEKPFASTGAGDAFNAGYLYGLLQDLSPDNALLWAVATSGIWVRTRSPATHDECLSFICNHTLSVVQIQE